MDYRDPQNTLALLDELDAQGLTRQMFVQLHHIALTATMGGHRSYCRNTGRFLEGSGNASTAHRLAVCLQQRKAGDSWETAIERALTVVPFTGPRGFLPTADEQQLEEAVSELATHEPPASPPAGQLVPVFVETGTAKRFVRDPNVIAWVERRADGVCEHCRQDAPFTRADGRPFLEVHHVVRLADGGSDRTCNATALCPNCHRLVHHSPQASIAMDRLYEQVTELRRET